MHRFGRVVFLAAARVALALTIIDELMYNIEFCILRVHVVLKTSGEMTRCAAVSVALGEGTGGFPVKLRAA